MATTDPRVDAYIERSAEFAQPILNHIRELVHETCPDVSETIKWGFPHFEYRGILCSIASFKEHCALNFWRGAEILGDAAKGDAMGHFGRITSVRDLPSRKLLKSYLQSAMKLNEAGPAVRPAARREKKEKAPVETPAELAAALDENDAARETFERFSPSHRREYIEWIAEARTDSTRQKRIATSVEWLSEGKTRMWKYERKK